MKAMKLTPLLVFILLLVVLLLAALLGKSAGGLLPEGFLAYGKDTPDLGTLTLPVYNKSAYKLYDSLYFDASNGNVIELFGAPESSTAGGVNTGTGGSSSTGTAGSTNPTTLTNLLMMPRTGMSHYVVSGTVANDLDPSLKGTTVESSFRSWSMPSGPPTGLPTGLQYQVNYIPWDKDTIVHVFDISNQKHVGLYTFSQTAPPTENLFPMSIAKLKPSRQVDPKEPPEPMGSMDSNPAVKMIMGSFRFNTKTGYLYQMVQMQMDQNNQQNPIYNVYNGNVNSDGTPVIIYTGVEAGFPTATTRTSSTTPFLIFDANRRYVVLYKYLGGGRTLIASFALNSTNANVLTLTNVLRFNSTGGIDGLAPPELGGGGMVGHGWGSGGMGGWGSGGMGGWGSGGMGDGGMGGHGWGSGGMGGGGMGGHGWGSGGMGEVGIGSGATLDDIITAYYQTQLGTSLGGTGTGTAMGSNYLLKTQIVPPVCPSCPSCVGCASCGNGGKGCTSTKSGDKKDKDDDNTLTGELSEFGGSLNDGAKNVGNLVQAGIKNAGNDIQSGANAVGSGIKTVSENVYGGIKEVTGDVYGGAKELVRGAKDVAGDIYDGVKDTADDVYDGIKRASRDVERRVHDSQVKNSRGTAGNYRGDVQTNMGWAGTGSGSINYVTTGVSPLTYYGAVPDRESSDFLPLTADFSRFGR